MFYDGPPGLMVDLTPPSNNGLDLLYSHEYVAQRMNLYAYARNNPLRYVDPSGTVCEKPTSTPILDPSYFYTRSKRKELYVIGTAFATVTGEGDCCSGAQQVTLSIRIAISSQRTNPQTGLLECYEHLRDFYLEGPRRRIGAGQAPFSFFRMSRPDICDAGEWKAEGDWVGKPHFNDCPKIVYSTKCKQVCCNAKGINTNFYIGEAEVLNSPIPREVMSFIKVRGQAKFGCRGCTAQASIQQYPSLSPDYPGYPPLVE